VTPRAPRRPGSWLLAIALLTAIAAAPSEGRKRNKHEIHPASLPNWVKAATERAPATSDQEFVWLHEEVIVRIESQGILRTSRYAGKVFKESGLDVVANWAVSYVAGDDVRKLESWTLQPDGTALRADPGKDIVDMPAIQAPFDFSDQRARVIDAQGVIVGSVVAFESVEWELLDVGMGGFYFGTAERPTLFSRFELQIPSGWTWERLLERADDVVEERTATGAVWVARDLQPLERESHRPSAASILPRVWVRWLSPDGLRGFEDWDRVGSWVREMSESVLEEPGQAAELAEQFKPREGEELTDALVRAFEFAAREVRYVAIDVGLGIGAGYRAATPATVCDKRYGDCKDKSYLMRALAEPWGVKTYPVLARTSDLGPLVEEMPSPGHFNHCIAAVELPDGVGSNLWNTADVEGIGRVIFLDATARENTPWGLPWFVQDTTGLLVHPGGATLIRLPIQPPEAGATLRRVDVEIDAEGSVVRARLEEKWTGTSASYVRRYYSGMSEDEHRAEVLEDLQDRFPGTQIVEYAVEGLDDVVKPVVETTTLQGGRLGKRVGDLLILEPGKTGYGLLAATLPKPPRTWPYQVGRPRQEDLRVSIQIPGGWKPEAVPDPLELESDYFVAGAAWSADDGKITYEREVSVLRKEVPVEDYPAFREDALKVRSQDRQAIVLIRE
jgi:hypothetical protein